MANMSNERRVRRQRRHRRVRKKVIGTTERPRLVIYRSLNHVEGQVIDDNDQQVHGVYATGWIKRGPVGLSGSTKSDAMETVKHVIHDQANWWSPRRPELSAITELLDSRGVEYTNIDGWHALDQHEIALGEAAGRARIKVVPRDEMVRISRAEPNA